MQRGGCGARPGTRGAAVETKGGRTQVTLAAPGIASSDPCPRPGPTTTLLPWSGTLFVLVIMCFCFILFFNISVGGTGDHQDSFCKKKEITEAHFVGNLCGSDPFQTPQSEQTWISILSYGGVCGNCRGFRRTHFPHLSGVLFALLFKST